MLSWRLLKIWTWKVGFDSRRIRILLSRREMARNYLHANMFSVSAPLSSYGLAKAGAVDLRFVEYALPSFVVFRNRIHLQLTLRNPRKFDKESGSIYKRAAQSFDLFLAPCSSSRCSTRFPPIPRLAGLDITLFINLIPNPAARRKLSSSRCP